MKKLLLIVPSRKRQGKITSFYEWFKKCSVVVELCLGYLDDVIIEHMHFVVNKAVKDEINDLTRVKPALKQIEKYSVNIWRKIFKRIWQN